MSDIFNDKNKVTGSFWKYSTIGDEVEGTLVGKSQKPDNFKPGQKQWVYELLTAEGDIVLIGGKPGIDLQMKHVRFGQIVGLRFVSEKENKTPGYDATKVVQIFADPKIVNADWLKANEEANMQQEMNGSEEGEPTYEEVDEGSPIDEALENLDKGGGEDTTANPLLDKINALAAEKLKIADPAKVGKAVQGVTDIAFIESNYPEILEALNKL